MEWVFALLCLFLIADFVWAVIVDRKALSADAISVNQEKRTREYQHEGVASAPCKAKTGHTQRHQLSRCQ